MSRWHVTREQAAKMAKKAGPRGFMPSASAVEISLPDIAGTFAMIERFGKVDARLKLDYHAARSSALAYGDPHRQEAEDLLDQILEAESAIITAGPMIDAPAKGITPDGDHHAHS